MSFQDSIRTLQNLRGSEGYSSSALRKLRTEIQYIVTRTGQNGLSDDEIIRIIKKEIKNRRGAAEQYSRAGRDDLATQESGEADSLEDILPPEVKPEEISRIAGDIIAEIEDPASLNTNRVMGAVMKAFQGQNINGQLASKIVGELLDKCTTGTL